MAKTLQKIGYKLYRTSTSAQNSFDATVEEDFNPDIVKLHGLDCFEIGMNYGAIIGVGITVVLEAIAVGIVAGIKKMLNRNRNKETS